MDIPILDWLVIAFAIAVVISGVIIVHELGHFLAARWAGVKVEIFSLGFGPILYRIRWGETDYAISLVWIGGYVKMLGQADVPGEDEQSDDPRSYQNKTVFQRMVIISAGVVISCIHTPERSGLPVASTGTGALRSALPSGVRGTPGSRNFSHCACAPTDSVNAKASSPL